MKSYKELIVWQKSFQLVLFIYKTTEKFPNNEIYGITSQLRRAAIAIPSNIAEGYNRQSKKEYLQFLYIAFGSGAELETQLLVSKELGYVNLKTYNELNNLLSEVLRMLNKLISTLKNY